MKKILFAFSLAMLICVNALTAELPALTSPALLPAVPDGAVHVSEKIFRKNPPEAAFDFAVFWYQIATLHQDPALNTKRSGIILKYCRVSGFDKSGNKIFEKNFEGDVVISPELGGLYAWFDPINKDKHTPIIGQQVFPGQGLIINASSSPDKVTHWWTERFPYDASNKYRMEMKVQIIGDVALQIGGDYWRGEDSPHNGWDRNCTGKNNCEAFVSQWYGDTKGEFITITREL